MIAVDTSALMAILRKEQLGEACEAALRTDEPILMSAATLAECLIVARRKQALPGMNILLELLERAYEAEGDDLERIRGWIADSGEGRWTVQTAVELNIPAPVITLALQMRFRSRQEESYGAQVIAALRNQFGGHAIKTSAPPGGDAPSAG